MRRIKNILFIFLTSKKYFLLSIAVWILTIVLLFILAIFPPVQEIPQIQLFAIIDILVGIVTFLVMSAIGTVIWVRYARREILPFVRSGKYFFIFLVLVGAFLLGALSNNTALSDMLGLATQATPTLSPIPTIVPLPTSTPTPPIYTRIATQSAKKASSEVDWDCFVLDDKTTRCDHPADARMSTPNELFIAVNNYRISHGIYEYKYHSSLCNIAQARAQELLALGHIDNHEGLNKYFDSQEEFSRMAEMLYGSVSSSGQPQSGTHIVEWGWDRSQTGHREGLQSTLYDYGCAGIAGNNAVFVMGRY